MEIKATLNKPYTETERCDFIVAQNHNKGYEIRETDEALEAWGYDDAEAPEPVDDGTIVNPIFKLVSVMPAEPEENTIYFLTA